MESLIPDAGLRKSVMGDSSHASHPSKSSELRTVTRGDVHKGCLVAVVPRHFSKKSLQCITSIKRSLLGKSAVADIGVFLLSTAALEIVRRLSKAKCPFVWRGLQALQLLCCPPFRWIQRWAPFRGLVKSTQALSRPMLALSIATVFSDESSQYDSLENSESESQSSSSDIRSGNEASYTLASQNWLVDLHKELDKQGVTLPGRLDEDELRRFYAATNCEFSKFVSSVKKTIHWRQTYTILSLQELEVWSRFVYWHGYDVKLRPCLIIRLGLACSNLSSSDRPLFARAIVSQIEHGIMNLVDRRHPQITVLMDCKGLSPFGFPMQMMRSCAILLQDHYPRRLGCLTVIRLPAVARVITQTLFQVLKPATRKKLRILGENYQEVLTESLQTLPLFLGGTCSCSSCLVFNDVPSGNGEIIQASPRVDLGKNGNREIMQVSPRADIGNNGNAITQTSPGAVLGNNGNEEITRRSTSPDLRNDAIVSSLHFDNYADSSMSRRREPIVIGMIMLWILIVIIWGVVRQAESLPFL